MRDLMREQMIAEGERVSRMLEAAVAEIEGPGELRLFNTALLVATLRFYAEVEGVTALQGAVGRVTGEIVSHTS